MSNKGEGKRERNLSDRKVPSIHLICRLGATWFQIWLRTETHVRAPTYTHHIYYLHTNKSGKDQKKSKHIPTT